MILLLIVVIVLVVSIPIVPTILSIVIRRRTDNIRTIIIGIR